MMMHAKSESGSTSTVTPSSSPRPVYYVQSPRDSHEDGDKSSASASVQATPAYNSTCSSMDSPSHPSTYGTTSSNYRSSSSACSRVSAGHWRWSRANRKRTSKQWRECRVIQESVDHDDTCGDEMDARRTYFLILFLGFSIVFFASCLIIWGASRPYKAQVRMMNLRVHDFYFGQGSDRTGVPTQVLTANCTATMSIHNPAKFFGIYVSSKQVDLIYSQITVASGELKKHFQPKGSSSLMSVNLGGRNIPLYGAGSTIAVANESGGVPMKLDIEVQSRGYLVGRLVKTKHRSQISCSFIVNSWGAREIKFQPNSCAYG